MPGAGEMAQQGKALAAKPDDLSSSPGSQMVEGENQLPQLSSNLHTCTVAPIHTPKINKT